MRLARATLARLGGAGHSHGGDDGDVSILAQGGHQNRVHLRDGADEAEVDRLPRRGIGKHHAIGEQVQGPSRPSKRRLALCGRDQCPFLYLIEDRNA